MGSGNDWHEEQPSAIEASCRQLVTEGLVEPLTTDAAETRSWMLWELASLAEGHLHVQLDVSGLSDARIGMWVWMWKHSLVFTWQKDLPQYRVEIDGAQARFLVEKDGQWRAVIRARDLGDRLGWESDELDRRSDLASWHMPGTFALHLALAGWPLVGSEENWEHRHHWSDAGEPEGLAYKVEIFEAIFRERGFEIRTPRIPGLQYRDLEEIE